MLKWLFIITYHQANWFNQHFLFCEWVTWEKRIVFSEKFQNVPWIEMKMYPSSVAVANMPEAVLKSRALEKKN